MAPELSYMVALKADPRRPLLTPRFRGTSAVAGNRVANDLRVGKPEPAFALFDLKVLGRATLTHDRADRRPSDSSLEHSGGSARSKRSA